MPATAAQRLAKFFPRLDDDLNSVSVYAPINLDCLEGKETELSYAGAIGGYDAKSACLTPVSFNMDLSIVANKGSLTLSVDVSTNSIEIVILKLKTCFLFFCLGI